MEIAVGGKFKLEWLSKVTNKKRGADNEGPAQAQLPFRPALPALEDGEVGSGSNLGGISPILRAEISQQLVLAHSLQEARTVKEHSARENARRLMAHNEEERLDAALKSEKLRWEREREGMLRDQSEMRKQIADLQIGLMAQQQQQVPLAPQLPQQGPDGQAPEPQEQQHQQQQVPEQQQQQQQQQIGLIAQQQQQVPLTPQFPQQGLDGQAPEPQEQQHQQQQVPEQQEQPQTQRTQEQQQRQSTGENQNADGQAAEEQQQQQLLQQQIQQQQNTGDNQNGGGQREEQQQEPQQQHLQGDSDNKDLLFTYWNALYT